MTTEELLRLIEQEDARHRRPGHDGAQEHPLQVCSVTIGTLFPVAGVPRRTIEEAIQQARLEGVPIITDGGIRVAQTAAEAHDLAGWLWGRIRSQMDTATAVQATAERMAADEQPATDLTLGLVAA